MPKIKIINGDSSDYTGSADLIFTDPPFDMPAKKLYEILGNFSSNHILLITTMAQFIQVYPLLEFDLSFDFVLDTVAPKKSRNIRQPNYVHSTGVYLHARGEKSRFNRKQRQRSDVFEGNGYWPTIFHAPRERMETHGMAKNLNAVTDLLGSFDVDSIIDPFAGSGTIGMAAFELGIDCTLIEKDKNHFNEIESFFRFVNCNLQVIK